MEKVLLNVNIISIIVGVVLFIFRIQLLRSPGRPEHDEQHDRSTRHVSGRNGHRRSPTENCIHQKRSYLSAALRLFIYPVFVLGLMKVIQTFASIQDSKQILLTVYLASITPACATVTSMAQLYDKDAAYSSSLYVLTTLLSIATMPVMVGLFEMVM